ncbi:MAG: N-6 DNA methylase [Deltaproteobacteria bacterium]|nr:N-6 DNA methylase [Candidatus Anaeroferrophillacea bacterium]
MACSANLLPHVCEYFLGEFALAEAYTSGRFYTLFSVVELPAEMLEPCKGRLQNPCRESGEATGRSPVLPCHPTLMYFGGGCGSITLDGGRKRS